MIIYQVEAGVTKDADGNVMQLTWIDVSEEVAIRAWQGQGLMVRTVRLEAWKRA